LVTTTHNAEETIELAQQIAKKLVGGEIIALHGDLGAGKTTFTKGLAEELRVEDIITSPTFVVLKNYPAKIKDKEIVFVHIDAYRSETIDDIKSVGIEDFMNRDDVVMIVEWPEKIAEILTGQIININFKIIDEKTRKIETRGLNDSNN
jgi:tRNA threonylcarbamoyladenosine biosynthesis protein TsaE